jgi:ribonuclease R
MKDMISFGENCSTAERRADAASYSVIDWLKCEYMQDHVGEEFTGTVASVTSFGLFVELNDIYIEGLVHITELTNDYYHFDPVRHCLEGERTRKVYRLGDTVDVRVVRVNLDEKKIDLQMQDSRAAVPGTKKSGIRDALRTGKIGKGKDSPKNSDAAKGAASRRSKRGKKAVGAGDGRAPLKKAGSSQSKPNARSKPSSQSKPDRAAQPSKASSGSGATTAPQKTASKKAASKKTTVKKRGVSKKANPAAGSTATPGTTKAKKRANRSGAAKKRVKAKAKLTDQ